MTYTSARPPVIKANLGAVTAPVVTIMDTAGNIAVSAAAMSKVTGTTMWYYPVQTADLSSTYKEYVYYVADSTGHVLEEGEFTVEDASTGLAGAIANKDIDCPSVVTPPQTVLGTKTYTVRFRPAAADGTFVSGVTEISGAGGPAISFSFKNPSNSANDVTGNMTLTGSMWTFDWALLYSTPADLVEVVISCEHGGKQYTFSRSIEIVKGREFNPQRLAVGAVG